MRYSLNEIADFSSLSHVTVRKWARMGFIGSPSDGPAVSGQFTFMENDIIVCEFLKVCPFKKPMLEVTRELCRKIRQVKFGQVESLARQKKQLLVSVWHDYITYSVDVVALYEASMTEYLIRLTKKEVEETFC